MDKLLLGIDVGTTSIKASLYTVDHRLVVTDCLDYTLLTPARDQVEMEPEQYWKMVCQLVRKLTEAPETEGRPVHALALSSQGETLICLDRNGMPVRRAIVWLDNRAAAEADALRRKFGRQKTYEISGQADMIATWPAAKILWLKQNEPETFKHTETFLLLADYLLYRMTGRKVGEPNLWASSAMLNIHDSSWWPEMLTELEVDERRLPEIRPCGTAIGSLLPEAAKEMGLNAECLAVTGALDQTCNMIGCGMTRPGTVMETTGSCLAVSALTEKFLPYREEEPITCQNSSIPGLYTVLLWSQSAGMTLKWFANSFYPECNGPEQAFVQIDEEAEKINAGSNGLMMLPHLTGAANPEYDSNATGVFAGITLEHRRPHFARAVMESVACMLKRNLDQLTTFGMDSEEVFCAGGGANSTLWLQIKADLCGKKMIPLKARDSACHGAAVLAGVGTGIYPDIHWSTKAYTGRTLEPDCANEVVYRETYHKYIALYDAMKTYFALRK